MMGHAGRLTSRPRGGAGSAGLIAVAVLVSGAMRVMASSPPGLTGACAGWRQHDPCRAWREVHRLPGRVAGVGEGGDARLGPGPRGGGAAAPAGGGAGEDRHRALADRYRALRSQAVSVAEIDRLE